MDDDEDLAHELLLGIPSTDANGWYHKREYLKPGSEQERRARAALARLLLKEAPGGFYTSHVAALINPLPGSRLEQKIEFARRRGGQRSTGRLDLEINEFFKDGLKLNPTLKDGPMPLIRAAMTHFQLSRRRIVQAWTEFNQGLVQTNRRV